MTSHRGLGAGGPPDPDDDEGNRRVEGVVREQLPSGLYQVDVDGARITAHAGSGLDRNFVRLLVGDRVVVELAPRDRTRGRVVKKL